MTTRRDGPAAGTRPRGDQDRRTASGTRPPRTRGRHAGDKAQLDGSAAPAGTTQACAQPSTTTARGWRPPTSRQPVVGVLAHDEQRVHVARGARGRRSGRGSPRRRGDRDRRRAPSGSSRAARRERGTGPRTRRRTAPGGGPARCHDDGTTQTRGSRAAGDDATARGRSRSSAASAHPPGPWARNRTAAPRPGLREAARPGSPMRETSPMTTGIDLRPRRGEALLRRPHGDVTPGLTGREGDHSLPAQGTATVRPRRSRRSLVGRRPAASGSMSNRSPSTARWCRPTQGEPGLLVVGVGGPVRSGVAVDGQLGSDPASSSQRLDPAARTPSSRRSSAVGTTTGRQRRCRSP